MSLVVTAPRSCIPSDTMIFCIPSPPVANGEARLLPRNVCDNERTLSDRTLKKATDATTFAIGSRLLKR